MPELFAIDRMLGNARAITVRMARSASTSASVTGEPSDFTRVALPAA